MQFYLDGRVYKTARTTGPSYNLLGIEFVGFGASGDAVVVEPVHLELAEPARLKADDVLAWTLRGLQQANQELGTDHRLRRVVFVVSDSPSASVYCTLAKRIVQRLHERPAAFNGIG